MADNTEKLQEIIVGVLATNTMTVDEAVEQAMELDMETRAKVADALSAKISKEQRKQLFGDASDATFKSIIDILQAATDAGALPDVPDGTKVRIQIVDKTWQKLVTAARTGAAKPAFRWTLGLLQKAGVSDIRDGDGELMRRPDKTAATDTSLDAVSYLWKRFPDKCFSERKCHMIGKYSSAEEALDDPKFIAHLEETGRKNEAKVREQFPNFKHGSNAGQLAAQLAADDAISRVGVHAASPLFEKFEGSERNGRKVVGMKTFWEELKSWYKAGAKDEEAVADDDDDDDAVVQDEGDDEDAEDTEEAA